MGILLLMVFAIGYTFIAIESKIGVDKAASAVLTGVLCWVVLVFGLPDMPAILANGMPEDPSLYLNQNIDHHLIEIGSILFFLMGAMTIVEMIDAHDGFSVITDRILTTDRIKLLWILSWISFFLSAILDNLTTAIVMSALLRRIEKDTNNLWIFAGFVIIAANAGGAWSPIGDITTIMLWIGGQITAMKVISSTFIPSAVALIVPLVLGTFYLRKKLEAPGPLEKFTTDDQSLASKSEQRFVFILGVALLLFVPIFKNVTHLPPFMGMMFGVGVLWFVTTLMHRKKDDEEYHKLSIYHVLEKIDTPSILFFLGILLAVGALDASGHLHEMAHVLDEKMGDIYLINGFIGIISSIIANVPLVAAAMGMYELSTYPVDSDFWLLLAYCAGTGGSCLVIGSAAGIAAMGILKIEFMWYVRNITLYAIVGYLAGILTYWLMHG